MIPASVIPSPVGTASAGLAVIDDFEDGDLNVEKDGWSGWGQSGGPITSTSADAISGDYSMKVEDSDTDGSMEMATLSEGTTDFEATEIVAHMKILNSAENADDGVYLEMHGETGAGYVKVAFTQGNIYLSSGSTSIGTYNTGTEYKVRVHNIDYTAETYDTEIIRVSDGQVIASATGTAFDWTGDSNSQFDKIELVADANHNGGTYTAVWDNVQIEDANQYHTVSGTVKDSSGSGIDGATVTVQETGDTTTTDGSGAYSFTLEDGSYTIEATKTGYNSGSTSVSVSGSDVTGQNITLSKDSITGQVTNQDGQPVENATVEAYVAEWATTTESHNKLSSLEDPIPQAWRDLEENPDLLGDHWSPDNVDSYVSTHTSDALPVTSPWLDNPNLDGTATVDLPANEPIILAAWRADATGVGVNRCLPAVSNEYDCQMPGEHKGSATIVIERIGPGGDITKVDELELTETSGGGYADPDDFAYAKIEAGALTPGFYYIHEKDAPRGVPRKVGTMTGMIDRYQQDVEGQLSEHAKTVQDYQNQGKITRITAKADANGEYTLKVPTTAKVVTVQAYHAPALVDDAGQDPTAITQNDIVTEYNDAIAKAPEARSSVETAIANSSVYFPSATKRVEPPASGVDLELVEVGAPPGANTTAENENLRALLQELRNKTFSEVTTIIQQEIVNEGIEELRAIYSQLAGTVKKYEPARERYLELSDRDTIAPASELSKSELRTEIGHLNTALYSTDLTGPITPPDPPEFHNETVSMAWDVPGVDLDEANVSVIAHWSNGTSQVVDEKYIEKDTGLGTDTVRLKKFPVGDTDPMAVQFSLRVATEDELRERRENLKNPAFSGELPRIQSIGLSSMEPGPNENVSVTVSPAEVGSFKKVHKATVYGPDGNTIATSPITDGRKFSFTTNGQGIHRIELGLQTTGGENVTLPVRVKALETDQKGPPMIRVKDSPIGKYALAGNGLEAAEIRADDGNQRATVVAQLAEDANVPSNLQVHLEEYALAGSVETDIRVVRGSGQEAVSQHVPVSVHYRATGDDVLVWRNGRPITSDGTRFGQVRTSSDLTVVETYTDGSGSVTIEKVNDPTYRQRLDHWLDVQLASLPFTLLTPMPVQHSVVNSIVLELDLVVDVLDLDVAAAEVVA